MNNFYSLFFLNLRKVDNTTNKTRKTENSFKLLLARKGFAKTNPLNHKTVKLSYKMGVL
jgi:hypothetical protein